MSSSNEHIPFARLVDLVEGRMPADDKALARAHVAACTRCAAELAWLERTIDLMRNDVAEPPPPYVSARAKRLIRQLAGSAAAGRRRVVATLSFDSARMPLAMGMRSAGQAERQLLFAAGACDLDLRVAQAGAQWVVSGQILGASAGEQVELHGPAGAATAALSDLCEFVLPPVAAGTYTLTLRLADLDIDIPNLAIGA
jgi:anti-sigma factor RsiW